MLRAVKLAGILGALGCIVAVEPVWAQCVESAPSGGRTPVSCTGADADGYAAAVDDVDLTIDAGATVDEGAAAEAILILDGSTVTNDGTVTATGTDTQGVDAGNNTTITNQGVGEIHGETGTDGIAVLFSGTDVSANNVLNNSGTGVIDTGGSVAVQGSVGNETVTLSDDSTLTGDIDLGDGTNTLTASGDAILNGGVTGGADGDTVTITGDATVTGAVDLGAGDDTLDIDGTADYIGNITAGAGNDDISLSGPDATLTGNVDLGDGLDSFTLDSATYGGTLRGGSGDNTFSILGASNYSGDYVGGVDGDSVDISVDATVSGTIDLGDGDNDLTLGGGTTGNLTGSIVGGSGIDLITIQDGGFYGTDVSGSTIDLGAGADRLIVGSDSTVFAEANLGGGSDTFRVRSPVSTVSIFTGTVDLGSMEDVDGDVNTLTIRVGAMLKGNVVGGLGDDQITVEVDGVIDGTANLGGGDDTVALGEGAMIGAIDLGDGDNTITTSNTVSILGGIKGGTGVDTVMINSAGSVGGNVDLGSGADTFELVQGATVTGNIDMGAGDDVLLYESTVGGVTGSIALGAGADTFALKPGSTLPGSATLTTGPDEDIDTLHLDGIVGEQIVGVVDLSTATEFQALLVGPGDSLNGFVWSVSTNGRINFADGIELQAGALVPDGKVELEGDFTHRRATRAAKLAFDLGPGGPTDPDNSQLDLLGKLTLEVPGSETPATDDNDLEGAASEVAFKSRIAEGVYTLITASDGIEGVFDVEVFPTSVVFTFSTEFVAGAGSADSYVLTIVREFNYDDVARSASGKRVGAYLEKARMNDDTGSFSEVSNALDLMTPSELKTALAQTNPEVYDAHTSSILSWGRMHQRVLQQRSMRCDRFTYLPRPEIISDSPCGSTGFMPWAKVVGDIGDHKGGESSGYETLGGGVLLGIDHRWNDRLWLSADIGFGRVDIEHDNGADVEFDTIDLGFAAGTEIMGVTTRGSLSYSHGFHETVRTIDFVNDRAKSKHDSDRVTLAAGAGYRLRVGPFVVEPNATIDYTHVDEEKAKESGIGLVGLDVNSRKTDVFSTTGGLRVGTNLLKYRYLGDWFEWADGVWSPNLSVQWRQGFGDVDRDQKAKMQGAPGGIGSFKSEAKDSDGGVEVGGHLMFQPLNTAASVEVGYDGYFGDDVINHSANVSVRIPF